MSAFAFQSRCCGYFDRSAYPGQGAYREALLVHHEIQVAATNHSIFPLSVGMRTTHIYLCIEIKKIVGLHYNLLTSLLVAF